MRDNIKRVINGLLQRFQELGELNIELGCTGGNDSTYWHKAEIKVFFRLHETAQTRGTRDDPKSTSATSHILVKLTLARRPEIGHFLKRK
jgi:hypothetical protein